MGIIKFKLLFIISSLVLALLPAGVMANTLQPGQNFNNENTEEQNESWNNNQPEQQNEYSEPSGQGDWTEPEQSYDNSTGDWNNNNNYNDYNNDNYNNSENYYDNSNNYNDDGGNLEQQEPVEQYEEPVQEEPVTEEPVEPEYEEPVEPEYEEPVTEESVIEEPVEPEPYVDVNTLDPEAFSISGEAVDEAGEGVSDIELTLGGESFDNESVTTDEDGSFLFDEVPPGNYEIEIKPAENYEVSESTVELEVTDRSKRGLKINLTEAEEEAAAEETSEPVETNEDVMAVETGSLSSMDWTLIGTGIVFAVISLFVLLFKRVRNN